MYFICRVVLVDDYLNPAVCIGVVDHEDNAAVLVMHVVKFILVAAAIVSNVVVVIVDNVVVLADTVRTSTVVVVVENASLMARTVIVGQTMLLLAD